MNQGTGFDSFASNVPSAFWCRQPTGMRQAWGGIKWANRNVGADSQ